MNVFPSISTIKSCYLLDRIRLHFSGKPELQSKKKDWNMLITYTNHANHLALSIEVFEILLDTLPTTLLCKMTLLNTGIKELI